MYGYAIYILDVDGRIVTWNRGAERIKGYKEEEVWGKQVSLFYQRSEIDKKLPEHELKIALQEGRLETEGWRVRKDQTLIYVNLVIAPLFDKNNQHFGYSKVTRDLTEVKKEEREKAENQSRYQLLIEGVESIRDYAIFVLDENGFVTSWNAGAKRINGYRETEIIGRHFSIFYLKDAVEAGYPDYELKRQLKTNGLKTKDGEP